MVCLRVPDRVVCLSVKTIISVPGKVVYLHYSSVYCAYTSLLDSFPFFPVKNEPDGHLVGKELVILFFECGRQTFCCVYVFSFPPTVYVET